MRAAFWALLVLVGLAFPARVARADPEAHCSARNHAWVEDAGRSARVPIRAVACTPDRLKLRLEPEGAQPLQVEITRSPEGAFQRVGGLGLSPVLQVDDFQQVPAARREPFERFARWLDEHADQVTFADSALPALMRAPAARVGYRPGAAWLLLAAALLAVLARLRAPRTASGDRASVAALLALALPLRMALGAWGPLRINGLGPLWIMAAAVNPGEAGAYGPGYAEIFSPLVRHLPLPPDVAVFAANAVISSLLPALLFALARLLGVDRRRALVVGLALALDPVSIRIAATESYVPVIAALTAAASVAAAAAVIHAARRETGRAVALALAAGCFCAQAARVHPVAWIPVALAPLAAAAVPGLALRARLGLGAAVTAVCGATVLLSSAPQLLHVYEGILSGEMMEATWMAPRLGVAALAGIAALVLVARPRWPLAVGALSALAVAGTRHNYGQSVLWQASFDRLYLGTLLVTAAALIPAPLARTRALVPAAAAALLALFARRAPDVLQGRTTDHEEYRWARGWLAGMPPSCRVAYVAFAGRRNLFLPTYAASPPLAVDAIARMDGREPLDAQAVLGPVGCTYYLRTSLCSSAEGRPVCEDVERQLVLDPVARASFAAVPSNRWLSYDREVVEAVVARVVGYRQEP